MERQKAKRTGLARLGCGPSTQHAVRLGGAARNEVIQQYTHVPIGSRQYDWITYNISPNPKSQSMPLQKLAEGVPRLFTHCMASMYGAYATRAGVNVQTACGQPAAMYC